MITCIAQLYVESTRKIIFWLNGSETNNNGFDDDEMELLNEAKYLEQAEIPETIRRSILAERERKSSTGVKVNATQALELVLCLNFTFLTREYLQTTSLLKLWQKRNEQLMQTNVHPS